MVALLNACMGELSGSASAPEVYLRRLSVYCSYVMFELREQLLLARDESTADGEVVSNRDGTAVAATSGSASGGTEGIAAGVGVVSFDIKPPRHSPASAHVTDDAEGEGADEGDDRRS